jgi:hypothetical protein
MNAMNRVVPILAALVLAMGRSAGQEPATTPSPTNGVPPPPPESEAEREWTIAVSVFTYLVPEGRDYAQPTLTVDRDWLHLEARYNYEDLDTGSIWAGYNFGGGRKLAWELSPILGGVFGQTTGVAPGYKGSLSWWKVELYSEGEYVIDTGNSSESFFYNWAELTLAPVDWCRFGMVTQRTHVYRTERDVQRGFLIGFSYKHLDLTAYVFNPDDSRPLVVLAAGWTF